MKRWSKIEDSVLENAILKHTKNSRVNWVAVSEEIEDRTPNQCRTHYTLHQQEKV